MTQRRVVIITRPEEYIKDRHGRIRTDIMKAACKVFIKRGYDRTSMRDLAVEFGMSKGGLYHYIGSKDEILNMIVDFISFQESEYFQQTNRQLSEIMPTQAMSELIDYSIRFHNEYQDMYVFNNHISVSLSKERRQGMFTAHERVLDRYEKVIRRGIETGDFTTEDPRFVAFMISRLVSAWSLSRHYLGRRYTMEQYVARVTQSVLGLLGVDPDSSPAEGSKRSSATNGPTNQQGDEQAKVYTQRGPI